MRLQIHASSPDVGAALRTHASDQAQLVLGRVSPRITGLEMYLQDVNGPRGGVDKGCRLVAKLLPRGEVVVHGSGGDWETLVQATLRRLARAVLRELDRRRAKRTRRIAS